MNDRGSIPQLYFISFFAHTGHEKLCRAKTDGQVRWMANTTGS